MTNREIQKKAKEFKRKLGLLDCTYAELRKITEKQGYTIVEFNHVVNEDAVKTLTDSLGLQENISHSKGFTYADKNYRIVFVHEDLSEEEKTKILAHENGHIYLGHFASSQVIGKDVQEEYEANEFAHYLQTDSVTTKMQNSIIKHKKTYVAFVSVLLVLAIIATAVGYIEKEKQYYGEYYITETGKRYHERDCIFVKDKNNIRRLTVEQFEAGEYEPCGICLPNEE